VESSLSDNLSQSISNRAMSNHAMSKLWPVMDDAIRAVFESMLADGSWGRYHGPHCDQLRASLMDYHQTEHAILCSSGTSAVELALRSVPVGQGDEVVMAAYDFKANFINVLTLRATPVLVDVQPRLPVMDVSQLERACSARTKAIIVSHLHGCLAPMDQICDFARARGISVIEDACQSPGALIGGRRAAAVGDVGVLSFGGSKLLTAGRGGAVITSSMTMAQRIKLYTQRGNEAYPLSEMQAAVLLPQLRQLDDRNRLRCHQATQFCRELNSSTEFEPTMSVATQGDRPSLPCFYKMAFWLSPNAGTTGREQLCRNACMAGIPLDPGFQALHLIHGRQRFRAVGDLTHATDLHHQLLTMHHTVLLQSDAEIVAMGLKLAKLVQEISHRSST